MRNVASRAELKYVQLTEEYSPQNRMLDGKMSIDARQGRKQWRTKGMVVEAHENRQKFAG